MVWGLTACMLLCLACRPDPPPQTGLSTPFDTATDNPSTSTWDTWDTGDAIIAPCEFEPEPGRVDGWLDVLGRLEEQRCLDAVDLERLEELQAEQYADGILHCDYVYRTSSTDGSHFTGDAEMVLQHASVPDVVITDAGEHLLVYNDLTPYKLYRVVRSDPERIWRQGLIGNGGLGMSIDRLDGSGFQEVPTLNLHLERVTVAVDPDLGRRSDGDWRMLWFGVHLDQYSTGNVDPLQTDKPHNFYRTVSADWASFPTAQVAVASVDGAFGGVDPTILDLGTGSEILFMGPMPETVLAWVSTDGEDWGDDTSLSDFDTLVPGVTPDAMTDPDGGYRLHYMENGRLGNFQVATSDDGLSWSYTGQTIRQVDDGRNLSMARDPDGVWWLYWNETDSDCVDEWKDAGSG